MDIAVPADLWDPQQEGSLLTWIYSDGDVVDEGDVVAEVIVEKSQFEIAAPKAGRLSHSLAEGDVLRPGDAIGRIE